MRAWRWSRDGEVSRRGDRCVVAAFSKFSGDDQVLCTRPAANAEQIMCNTDRSSTTQRKMTAKARSPLPAHSAQIVRERERRAPRTHYIGATYDMHIAVCRVFFSMGTFAWHMLGGHGQSCGAQASYFFAWRMAFVLRVFKPRSARDDLRATGERSPEIEPPSERSMALPTLLPVSRKWAKSSYFIL